MTDTVYELNAAYRPIQCKNTGTVHIETGDIDYREEGRPIQLYTEQSKNRVRITINEALPGDGASAGVTLFLSTSGCEMLAEALREGSQARFFKKRSDMWLRKGWMWHDGFSRDDPDVQGELEYTNGSLSIITTQTGDSDSTGSILLAAKLTEAERNWLASRLEEEAEIASDYEPPSHKSESESANPRIPTKVKRGATTLGVTAFASWVGIKVTNEIAGSMTTNGQQLPEFGPLAVVPFLLLTLVVIIGLDGRHPRKVNAGGRP